LATLRSMGRRIAEALDDGQAPVQQAAMLKDLGTAFESEVNELARTVLEVEPDPFAAGDAGLLAQGVLAAPGFTLRGGATEILRTIIARGAVTMRRRSSELSAVADDVLDGHGGDPAAGQVLPLWTTVTELGWPGVGTPEELGGCGGSLDDLAALVEACGRNAVALPLAESAWAGRLLAAAGRALPEGPATVVLPRDGEELRFDGRALTGTAIRVPWGAAARRLLVLARDTAGSNLLLDVAADAAGVTREPGTNLAAEPRDTIRFDGVAVAQEYRLPAPGPVAVAAAGALLRAAATVGALETAVAHTVSHVTAREQFGRPLVKFQAVGATLAQITAKLTLARTAVDSAVAASREAVDVDRVAAAVVIAGLAATEVARGAHQLHGAMGVTREHPLHLVTRRLWSWRDEFGGDRYWALLLGRRMLPLGPDGVWDWLTTDFDDAEGECR
jgi:alkylation response protein AidB-like acyl-CoA dehydrogenase